MKFIIKKKSLVLTFIFFTIFSIVSKAQLTVDTTMAPTNMVMNLLASPSVLSNPAFYTGHPKSIGHFLNGNTTNLGLNSGIIMTTGLVNGTPMIGSPSTGFASTVNGIPENPTLTSLYDMFMNEDAAFLDFQIVPLYDTLKFRYVFASEEYPLFNHDPGADKFGFFISGPDPTGGNYNKKNIALITNTSIPVSINTVHSDTNSQYYVDNSSGMTIVFNGFTKVLTAWCLTSPCQMYDVRIVVADLGLGQYDSAIFLEEGSLTSTSIVSLLNINTQPQSQCVNVGDNATFTIYASAGTLINYQWQVSSDHGSSWSDIDSAGSAPVYSGWHTDNLNLTGTVAANNGYRYRCIVKDATCCPADTSSGYSTLYLLMPSGPFAVHTGLSYNQMAKDILAGPGICVDSVKYKGDVKSIGSFVNGAYTNLGMNSGLILCSGYVDGSGGTQIGSPVSNFLSDMTGSGSDPQLQQMVNNSVNDASALTFDFVPHSDTIKFRFVFGSEEYPEFVGSSFCEAFGAFISGPNPLGGNYSDSNIALIPGTILPITINNLNNSNYPQFYVDNQSMSGQTIVFDGFSIVLTASCPVVPCARYIMKLAIGDVSDQAYDSGVFLEAGSLVSTSSPVIESSPSDQFVEAGDSTSFNVSVSYGSTVDYQWQVSNNSGTTWSDINTSGNSPVYGGWNTSHLTLSNIPDSCNGYLYRCIVYDSTCSCALTDFSENAAIFIINPNWPTVITSSVGNIGNNSAVSGGSVITDGGFNVNERGVCWSENFNPNVTGDHTSDGAGLGSFISDIIGLSPGTTYYVRAYATNGSGTSYGNIISFTTSTTSIEEVNSYTDLMLYPNPTKDFITIKSSVSFLKCMITIYDITGRIVLKKELLQSETQIDVSRLASGIYYLKLSSDKIIGCSKFIKQ
jgi:hypothetical protein